MTKLLREPLVHFILLGIALFAAWQLLKPPVDERPVSREIQLSLDEIAQLALLFQARWNREPTTEELARLVDERVTEEVLYREALALGLDKDDTIVKRRMAQKMRFLAEDVAAAREPAERELGDWYRRNSAMFARPKHVSFRHLYFSPDRRGSNARGDAAKVLATLAGRPEDAALAEGSADRFMFQEYYREMSPELLGRDFGPAFAVAVSSLAPGTWQGPVESGYGWHLVYVDAATPERIPEFEEVVQEAKVAWLAERKAIAWEQAYKDIRAGYTVLLPPLPDVDPADGQVPERAAAGPDDDARQ